MAALRACATGWLNASVRPVAVAKAGELLANWLAAGLITNIDAA
jgi:hypothetical protein